MPNLLPLLIAALGWTVSILAAGLPLLMAHDGSLALQLLALAAAPAIFIVTFPTTLGLMSRPFQKGIIAGKFPREPFHKVYFSRRVYGACWTQVFYFKPVYSVILAIPVFKKLVFRLFGYKGQIDFTVYPDTWIRDLPLLKIEKGAYLANRATIGTNLVLTDGSILVQGVQLETRALVGHLCIIGTGARIGERAEIGMRSSIGIRVRVLTEANIKPHCAINHGTVVKERASIGTMSLVGMKCMIGENVRVPSGAIIPDGAVLQTQADCDRYFSSEVSDLVQYKERLLAAIKTPGSYESTSSQHK